MTWTVTTPGHWRTGSRHEFLGHLTAHVVLEYSESDCSWSAHSCGLFVSGVAPTLTDAKHEAMRKLCESADNAAADLHAAREQEAKS